ncbi:hypothetical protein K2Y11_15145 [bacterium]|nr:hypothetical protein [bacterium]
MSTRTIFYSWQADISASTNRTFIADCLERAINQLKSDGKLNLELNIDRDTSGVGGSPDIANTIFEKIANSHVFVGDVTIIGNVTIDDSKVRPVPNPNVLVELGYAASGIGWDKIILVVNMEHGQIESLPFDLRARRAIGYSLKKGEDKTAARSNLVSRLAKALHSILSASDPADGEFLNSLHRQLVEVLILSDEFEEKAIGEPAKRLRRLMQTAGNELRELAIHDYSHSRGLADDLNVLAEKLISEHDRVRHNGSRPDEIASVKQIFDLAKTLASKTTEPELKMERRTAEDAIEFLRKKSLRLAALAKRAATDCFQGKHEDVKSDATEIGEHLLKISYCPIRAYYPDLPDRLRPIARRLHFLECYPVYHDGGATRKQIVDALIACDLDLKQLLNEMGS